MAKNAATARWAMPTKGMGRTPRAPRGARNSRSRRSADGCRPSPLFDRNDDHAHALDAFVHVETESPREPHAVGDRLAAAEPDGVAHDAADAQREPQVLVADELLRDD